MADDPVRIDRDAEAARRRGMIARVAGRTRASAEIAFPAIPSLATHYTDILADHFAALGRPFAPNELDTLHGHLQAKLREAYDVSPASQILVRYHTAAEGSSRIDYAIAACTSSLTEQYDEWARDREPPLFGAHPDARVMAEARALPVGSPVLDIGAGNGRNAFPLARLGLSVDALEPTPTFADSLEADARKDSLSVQVHRADVLSADLPLEPGRHALVVASEITSHFRRASDLRAFFRRLAVTLRPGGKALVNAFLTAPDVRPDAACREAGQVFWSTFFTPSDLASALRDLPLQTLEDIDALEYEKSHLPPEAWPPTGWYERWARGADVFGDLPRPAISLRWLLLQRTPGGLPAD